MNNNSHFAKGKPIFKCVICKRNTRQAGQDVTHLCAQCYEIAGIDNAINDNGGRPGMPEFEDQRPRLNALLKRIGQLGGNVQAVKDANSYAFPPPPLPLDLEQVRQALSMALAELSARLEAIPTTVDASTTIAALGACNVALTDISRFLPAVARQTTVQLESQSD